MKVDMRLSWEVIKPSEERNDAHVHEPVVPRFRDSGRL